MTKDKDVHTEHCCKVHGCKYGDETCSVVTGLKKQSYPCENCGDPPGSLQSVPETGGVPDIREVMDAAYYPIREELDRLEKILKRDPLDEAFSADILRIIAELKLQALQVIRNGRI
jgi:hypothetical protein